MIKFLIENPFIVIFALFILTIIVYFVFEIVAKHKRLEKHYTIKKVLWGAILIVIALIILFTPILGFTIKALFHPGSTELVTILSSHLECSPYKGLTSLSQECIIIELITYTSIILIIIGLVLIVAGLVWLR